MHDGSIATLEAVVVHYARGLTERKSLSKDLPRISLTDAEVKDIVAFLETLTSDDPPVILPVMP